ncbi:tetratricopeptide repeat protein [Thalassotalea euphylliae]|uniref:tetratricopeptide repeat protein n=1 Tax=Thalassotalea euphylliae TaxID=1655234 RepID=UPI00363CB879
MLFKNIDKLVIAAVLIAFSQTASAEKIGKCDTPQCVEYFKKYKTAAKRGHPLAMLTLGQFYHHGYGTEEDEKKALKYFKKAARAGYTSGQFKAGYIFMTSEELRDIGDATYYLEKAAKYDYEGANFLLGMLHFDKKYDNRDLEKADEYFAASYKKKYEQMPTVVKFIEAEMPIDQKNFPQLYAAMNDRPLAQHKDGTLSFHDENVEVITITSPPLVQTFNKQLVSFRKAIKSTGTRFQGKTCAERLTCMQRADIADSTDFNNLFLDGFGGASNSQ